MRTLFNSSSDEEYGLCYLFHHGASCHGVSVAASYVQVVRCVQATELISNALRPVQQPSAWGAFGAIMVDVGFKGNKRITGAVKQCSGEYVSRCNECGVFQSPGKSNYTAVAH